jgi:glycine cleavage system H protein
MRQLRFTKEHEWVNLENDIATCGITEYAQKALGDIVYVELPALGKQMKRGEEAAVVESAKAASEVYAPIDGEVTAVNDNLSSQPGMVNEAPTGEGWFFKIKPSDKAQIDALMDTAGYEKYIKELLS